MVKGLTINISITGTKGFLGKYLCKYFHSQPGIKVFKLSSSEVNTNKNYYSIGEEINDEILCNTNILILCAHDFKSKDEYFQLNGFKIIKKQIDKLSLNIKIVYISSLAAFEKAESIYGKSKYLTEMCVIKNSGIIIKPGIIYGNKNIKGLVNKITNFTEKYRIVPNLLNLNAKIYLTHIEDLCFVINEILINEKKGIFLCVNLNSLTFKQLVIKFSNNKKIIFIPLFWQLLYLFIKILEFLRIRIGFRSDSILSLAKQNKKPKEKALLEYTKYFRN